MERLICGDTTEELKKLNDQSIDCCITSPPYWGLRDYGVNGQIGLEQTPEEYIMKITKIFGEIKRILKDQGTLWINLGDTYNAMTGKGFPGTGQVNLDVKEIKQIINRKKDRTTDRWGGGQMTVKELPPKNLIGIPWRVALSLQSDGWFLRQDIIWHKPNPMPESVTDRCTKSHEYIFLLAKSQKYYFNNEVIKELTLTQDNSNRNIDITKLNNTPGRTKMAGLKTNNYELRNKRSVWTISTKPFKDAHFATFPEDLILPCVLAGCPQGGVILDPFAGAGTTGVVAKKNGRNFIGVELNPKYIEIAQKRIDNTMGYLF